jgi:hypothetical protein
MKTQIKTFAIPFTIGIVTAAITAVWIVPLIMLAK